MRWGLYLIALGMGTIGSIFIFLKVDLFAEPIEAVLTLGAFMLIWIGGWLCNHADSEKKDGNKFSCYDCGGDGKILEKRGDKGEFVCMGCSDKKGGEINEQNENN